jgi:hypothetical protein
MWNRLLGFCEQLTRALLSQRKQQMLQAALTMSGMDADVDIEPDILAVGILPHILNISWMQLKSAQAGNARPVVLWRWAIAGKTRHKKAVDACALLAKSPTALFLKEDYCDAKG